MEEIDQRAYMQEKISLSLGISGLKHSITDTPFTEMGFGKEIIGKLDTEKGYSIRTENGERVPMAGGDALLSDPKWKEEDPFGKKRKAQITERFGDAEVVLYGMLSKMGFLPYLAMVKKTDGSTRFYYGDAAEFLENIIEKKTDTKMPIRSKNARLRTL